MFCTNYYEVFHGRRYTACVSWRFACTSSSTLCVKLTHCPPHLSLQRFAVYEGFCAADSTRPPCSANRNPGNQHVWPKPLCFTRFTNPQWDVMKTTTHMSVVLNFWKMQSMLHPACVVGDLLTKKLMTRKPWSQNPELFPWTDQFAPEHCEEIFCSNSFLSSKFGIHRNK